MLNTIAATLVMGLLAAILYAIGELILGDAILKRHRPLYLRLLSYVFTVYLVVLLRLAVVPGAVSPLGGYGNVPVNLEPFHTIRYYLRLFVHYDMVKPFAANVFGNVLLLLPLGFFLPLLFKSGSFKWWKMLLLCLAASVAIESTQWVLDTIGLDHGRVVDIDDVILNVAGGLAGYWLYLIVQGMQKALTAKFREHRAKFRM